jgi:hypothetical protein
MAITILVGVVSNGDMARIAIYGLAGGILFGAGGFVIGSLVQSYIMAAAIKEAEKRALDKELTRKMVMDQIEAQKAANPETRGA